MQPTANFDRKPATPALLAIALLLSILSGCVVDMVQQRQSLITESQGLVLVPPETAELLQCADGLLLHCTTGFGRLADRECRCVR
jgi:hypothetical protein